MRVLETSERITWISIVRIALISDEDCESLKSFFARFKSYSGIENIFFPTTNESITNFNLKFDTAKVLKPLSKLPKEFRWIYSWRRLNEFYLILKSGSRGIEKLEKMTEARRGKEVYKHNTRNASKKIMNKSNITLRKRENREANIDQLSISSSTNNKPQTKNKRRKVIDSDADKDYVTVHHTNQESTWEQPKVFKSVFKKSSAEKASIKKLSEAKILEEKRSEEQLIIDLQISKSFDNVMEEEIDESPNEHIIASKIASEIIYFESKTLEISKLIEIVKIIEQNPAALESVHDVFQNLTEFSTNILKDNLYLINQIRVQLEKQLIEQSNQKMEVDIPKECPSEPIVIEDDPIAENISPQENLEDIKPLDDKELSNIQEDAILEVHKFDWEKSTTDFNIETNEKGLYIDPNINEFQGTNSRNYISAKSLANIFWNNQIDHDSEDEMMDSFINYSSLIGTINQVNKFRFSKENQLGSWDIPGLNWKKSDLEILRRDIEKWESNVYLNDVLVNYYMAFIETYICPDKKIYSFTTYFSNKLFRDAKGSPPKIHYSGVSRYSKKVDLMEQDFVIIPIWNNEHWTLYIVWYPIKIFVETNEPSNSCKKPWILFFDSMRNNKDSTSSFATMDNEIVQYIYEEFMDKKFLKLDPSKLIISDQLKLAPQNDQIMLELRKRWEDIMIFRPSVPTQYNAYDCGVFALEYVERFLRNSDEFLQKCFQVFEEEHLKFNIKCEEIKKSIEENQRIQLENEELQKKQERINRSKRRRSIWFSKDILLDLGETKHKNVGNSQKIQISKFIEKEDELWIEKVLSNINEDELNINQFENKSSPVMLNRENSSEQQIITMPFMLDSNNTNEEAFDKMLPIVPSEDNIKDESESDIKNKNNQSLI